MKKQQRMNKWKRMVLQNGPFYDMVSLRYVYDESHGRQKSNYHVSGVKDSI